MLPVKYNPIRVVIEKRLKQEVVVNPVYGSPVGAMQKSQRFEIQAQFNIMNKKFNAYSPTPIGNEDKTSGKLLIRKDDYDQLGFTIDVGDRIVEVGEIGSAFEMDAMVVNVRPGAPLNGKFLLMVIEFEQDRNRNAERIQ